MLTPGTTKSSALVTTVTHGQTEVEVRVVAAPAVGCVMQLVTSAEPLVLLDSFVLSDLAPAPAGVAKLELKFELQKRAPGAALPTLRVECSEQGLGGGSPRDRTMTIPVVLS